MTRIERSKEWWMAKAKAEEGHEVSAGVPRRSRIDLFTPAEKAIFDAVQIVEAAGCDVRLTAAVNKLAEARALVADFVDGVPVGEGYPRPASPMPGEAPEPNIFDAIDKSWMAKWMGDEDGWRAYGPKRATLDEARADIPKRAAPSSCKTTSVPDGELAALRKVVAAAQYALSKFGDDYPGRLNRLRDAVDEAAPFTRKEGQ